MSKNIFSIYKEDYNQESNNLKLDIDINNMIVQNGDAETTNLKTEAAFFIPTMDADQKQEVIEDHVEGEGVENIHIDPSWLEADYKDINLDNMEGVGAGTEAVVDKQKDFLYIIMEKTRTEEASYKHYIKMLEPLAKAIGQAKEKSVKKNSQLSAKVLYFSSYLPSVCLTNFKLLYGFEKPKSNLKTFLGPIKGLEYSGKHDLKKLAPIGITQITENTVHLRCVPLANNNVDNDDWVIVKLTNTCNVDYKLADAKRQALDIVKLAKDSHKLMAPYLSDFNVKLKSFGSKHFVDHVRDGSYNGAYYGAAGGALIGSTIGGVAGAITGGLLLNPITVVLGSVFGALSGGFVGGLGGGAQGFVTGGTLYTPAAWAASLLIRAGFVRKREHYLYQMIIGNTLYISMHTAMVEIASALGIERGTSELKHVFET